ncbi:MAG: hypothetical protein SGBAC_011592 [Bacillariaceae sp.]
MMRAALSLGLTMAMSSLVCSFPIQNVLPIHPSNVARSTPTIVTCRYNFFKDMVSAAFENDRSLSGDKTKGQYDAPGEEFEDRNEQLTELTTTQLKWRETQLKNDVTPEMVTGTSWTLDLFLSGVPERDPSNDLYGSRVNISSRDRQTGLNLPGAPSTSVTLTFLKDGVCRVSESGFTSGDVDGQWKLSEDGNILRFSMDSLGYTRMVQTKGSIQNVYWTDEEEKSIQTSSSYSIPPGLVYGDVELTASRNPGTFEMDSDGVLRIEKESGLFGISSQMKTCGKFEARRKDSS